MADQKISQLTAATTPLVGTEVLPIVQSGTTKKVSVENVLTSAQPSGTANGVVYLNSSKIASSGSGLTFNGTNFGVGTGSPEEKIDVVGQIQARPVTNTTGNADWFVIGSIEEASNFGVAVGIEVENSGANAYGMNFGVRPPGSGIVTRLRLSSSGDVTVNTGNLVIGTAGKGIDFSADGQAAGMTSELLDDYEEGTWTPSFFNLTVVGTATYTGKYTKIGRQVTFVLRVQSDTSTESTFSLTGFSLPFVAADRSTVTAVQSGAAATYGVGLIAIDGNAYPPTWSANADVTIVGTYFV
jgi:hypothetical protein